MELKNGKTIKLSFSYENPTATLRKFSNPLYGECLISKGMDNDKINLWQIIN